jgi:hypothetical protein
MKGDVGFEKGEMLSDGFAKEGTAYVGTKGGMLLVGP